MSYPSEADVLRAVVTVSRATVHDISRLVSEDRLSKSELEEELRLLARVLSPSMIEQMKRMPIPAPVDSSARPVSPAIVEL
jgi:hypothetical protein